MNEAKSAIQRLPAEQEFAGELEALAKEDTRQKPPHWKLSPWAVVTYLIGGKTESGVTITPKYVGQRRLMEIAVATLATDRALLLLGLRRPARMLRSSSGLPMPAPSGSRLMSTISALIRRSVFRSWVCQ